MDQHSDLVRITRLERLLALALFLAIVPWFALGAIVWKFSGPRIEFSKVLVAPGIEVVKADGTTAASLTVERDAGHLALHSVEGPEFATLGQQPGQGGALALLSPTQTNPVWLGCDKEGGGNLTLRNKANETVVVVSDNEGYGGGFCARRGDDRLIAFFGAGNANGGALQLNDKDGQQNAYLGRNQHGHGALTLTTRSGANFAELGAGEAAAPFLVLRGADGKSRAEIQVEGLGGKLRFYDEGDTLRTLLGRGDDGTHALELFSRAGEHMCLLGESETLHGGVIQAYGPGDRIAFCAGVDRHEGAGIISLHHPSGQQIFAAGMSGDDRGGIINVHDLDGRMILRTP